MADGRRVHLEPPTRERAKEFLAAVARSTSLHRNLATPPATPVAFSEYLRRAESARHAFFLVIDDTSSDIAGVINISEIVHGQFQSAYLGYYAFEPFAGKGFMRAGLLDAIDYAFADLGLHRLEANIQPDNARSIALVSSLGFEKEGYSRRYLKIAGRWRDHERWAMLSEDWSARRWNRSD